MADRPEWLDEVLETVRSPEWLDEILDVVREGSLRFERVMRAHSADVREELRVIREENRAYFEELRADTREIIAENRAQRACLFKILDELRGNGPATAC